MTAEAGRELDARPLLRRQLDALADWLAKDHWTLPEAASLLVGFVPLDADGGTRPFGPWLPGREPWPQREAWEWTVGREMDDMRQRLATIPNLGFKAPKEIVGLAIKAGVVPPWIPALLESEHAKLLPAALRAEARTATGAEPTEPEVNSRAHGSFKARPDNWAEAANEAERLFINGASNKKIADLLATKGLGTWSQSAVDGWIRDFRNGRTAADMTAEFRRWKEHNAKA